MVDTWTRRLGAVPPSECRAHEPTQTLAPWFCHWPSPDGLGKVQRERGRPAKCPAAPGAQPQTPGAATREPEDQQGQRAGGVGTRGGRLGTSTVSPSVSSRGDIRPRCRFCGGIPEAVNSSAERAALDKRQVYSPLISVIIFLEG